VVIQSIERERRVAPDLPNATVIPALPPPLQEVPVEARAWAAWKVQLLAFRAAIRQSAATDPDLQRALHDASADDPAFFIAIFGAIYEPRWIAGEPPGWRPWVPYAFQVEAIRVAQEVLKTPSGPERHLLVEKSRDMGMSWLFCALAAHAWLFAPSVSIAMVSREAKLVDMRGDFNSMFFKVRGVLGIEETIPEDQRLPPYIFPSGFRPSHDKTFLITHPSRPNQISGETTTKNSGRGSRVSWRINDEAAFNRNYQPAKAGQFNTTEHIVSISSAGMDDGGTFKEECEEAAANKDNPHVRTQTHLRLDWWLHPLHDETWYRETKAEMDKVDPTAFDREVLINYTAGTGRRVYPDLQAVAPLPVRYVPGGGPVVVAIDPGLADHVAILWAQYVIEQRRHRIVRAFTMPNTDAAFVASVLTGAFDANMSGEQYKRYLAARDTMLWIRSLRDPITYVGDPYGFNRGGDGLSTYYGTLATASDRLTGGRNVISVLERYDEAMKEYRLRREAVQALLPALDWSDEPDVQYALEMCREAKYPDMTKRAVSEPDKPIHNRTSHFRSALEYLAVNVKVEAPFAGMSREVEIVTLGGGDGTSVPPFARGMDLDFRRDMPVRDDRTLFHDREG
jgi:hypothetical protein